MTVIIMLAIFVIGYLAIAFEHVLHINKAAIALLMCGLLWATYVFGTPSDHQVHEHLIEVLGDTAEIVVFLIGAMTIVELIDKYGGFNYITRHIKANNKRGLMWVLAVMTFFLSAVLDNMTTTIILVMMLRRLLSDQKERWIFAGVIIIAANSGGAWSPIGDVTTIMLWMKNNVTSVNLIEYLLLPCIVSVVIPVLIAQSFVRNSEMEMLNSNDRRVGYEMSKDHPKTSLMIFFAGVSGLLFVPIFKSLTGLPPYMGILISLGALWILTEIIVKKYDLESKMEGRVSQAIKTIDMSTILFFLGILMSVSALQQVHLLSDLAEYFDSTIHEPYTISGLIGVMSSIVDNVPLVAACINMYEVVDPATLSTYADPQYMNYFIQDGLFWHLLTFCAGVGGSLLIIGSAAGVVAMGIEKIEFGWYMKKFFLLAFAGYLGGMLTIWVESAFLPSLG